MIATAWRNGSESDTGAGYGLKLSLADRERYFRREWGTVSLELEGWPEAVRANIAKSSFWTSTCGELISADIGRWLLANRLAPWAKRQPPKVELRAIGERRFRVEMQKPKL